MCYFQEEKNILAKKNIQQENKLIVYIFFHFKVSIFKKIKYVTQKSLTLQDPSKKKVHNPSDIRLHQCNFISSIIALFCHCLLCKNFSQKRCLRNCVRIFAKEKQRKSKNLLRNTFLKTYFSNCLFTKMIHYEDQSISKRIYPKNNENFVRISALASKKKKIKK